MLDSLQENYSDGDRTTFLKLAGEQITPFKGLGDRIVPTKHLLQNNNIKTGVCWLLHRDYRLTQARVCANRRSRCISAGGSDGDFGLEQ